MKKRTACIAIFLLPSMILFISIYAVPLVTVVFTSFTNSKFLKEANFVGLQNYIYLFIKDTDFKMALYHTILWIVILPAFSVGFATITALVLYRKTFGWKFTQTVFMIPNIISSSAFAIMFLNIFSPQIGFVNSLIRAVGFKEFYQNWLFDSTTAFFTVTISMVFYAGFLAVLVMSEIASIPESIIESAMIDGATHFQTDFKIIFPMLRNIIGTAILLTASGAVNLFDFIYLTTRGGPGNATYSLPMLLFRTISLENNIGLGNTIGVVQLIIGIIVMLLLTKAFKIGKSIVN